MPSYKKHIELLKEAQELLWDGVGLRSSSDISNLSEFMCYCLTKAASCHGASYERAREQVNGKIYKEIGGYIFYDSFLRANKLVKRGDNPAIRVEIQCQRWMFLEEMIQYYKQLEEFYHAV